MMTLQTMIVKNGLISTMYEFEKPEANDSNDEKHKLVIRRTELQRSIIVIHC